MGSAKRLRCPGRQGRLGVQSEPALGEAGECRDAVAHANQRCGERCNPTERSRVMRQKGKQAVAHAQAMPLSPLLAKFDFHLRHVDAGWAFAPTGFTRHTKAHGLGHALRGHRVITQVTVKGLAQGIGATAGEMLLITRDPETRAHGTGIKFPAMAVVVAHLDGFGESESRVVPCAGCAQQHGTVNASTGPCGSRGQLVTRN